MEEESLSEEGTRRLDNPLMPGLGVERVSLPSAQVQQTPTGQTRAPAAAAPATGGTVAIKGVKERLEPLLAFLEEERVLNPAYSLQNRRALTVEDKLDQLEEALEALPISQDQIASTMASVRAMVPKDRELTLAEALAPSKKAEETDNSLPRLDARTERTTRRWLEKRRHVYRERRNTRVRRLLQDLAESEKGYALALEALNEAGRLLQQEVDAEEWKIVFGPLEKAALLHKELAHVAVQVAGGAGLSVANAAEQRLAVADLVLPPLEAAVRGYGPFFGNALARASILQQWATHAPTRKVVEAALRQAVPGGPRLGEVLKLAAQRIEGYRRLAVRLELLLEEERVPLGGASQDADAQVGRRVQAACARLAQECARLQGSVAQALNQLQVAALAQQYRLGKEFAVPAERLFVRQHRVRVKGPGGHRQSVDDAGLILFSDTLVLVNNISGTTLVQSSLQNLQVEPDTELSWGGALEEEESGGGATLDDEARGMKDSDRGTSSRRGFAAMSLNMKMRRKEQSVPELDGMLSPDMAVLAADSPAFRIIITTKSGSEDKWHVLCSSKAIRVSLVEDLLNHKFRHRVFGQSIAFLAERDGDAVPEIVRTCSKELRRRADEEGVFRIPGRGQLIDSVVSSVNQGMRVDISNFHVHDIAGIFKVWYRMLPTPVIPRPLLSDFIATNAIKDPMERATALRQLCERKLPSNNLRVLSFTSSTLAAFHAAREKGKMDADNLATVFAPALFFCLNQPIQTKEEILENAKLGPDLQNTISFIIAHSGSIFDDASAKLKTNLLAAAEKK